MRNPFAKSKKRTRGKSKTAKEKIMLQEARYLDELRTSTDPEDRAEYKAIMSARLGRKAPKEKEHDRLTETVETLKLLKDAGLVEDPRNAGGGFNWKDLLSGLSELGKAAPAIMEQFNGGALQPAYEQPPAETAHQLEQPRKETPPQMPRMTILSQTLIWRVHNKTPDQVADMLLEQYDKMPIVAELVDGFCQTPNEEFEAFLNNFAAKYPDIFPFMAWLNEEKRRAWFGQCILAVRQKASGAELGAEASEMGI